MERAMDSLDLEQERGITIMAKVQTLCILFDAASCGGFVLSPLFVRQMRTFLYLNTQLPLSFVILLESLLQKNPGCTV